MDGDRKKRKIDKELAAVEEEESEEEKMEKFFALIRSTREARDHLRGIGLSSSEETEKSREDRRKAEEDHLRQRESGWNPTFRPEDFSQDPVILYKPSTTIPSTPHVPSSSGHEAQAGPSESKQEDEGKDGDDYKKKTEKDDGDGDGGMDGLNLKLSL
ncbi:hypothetical protein BT93_C0958 [Corymbia citriodora subsp. variegata]|nr:hypothetical protein BT93_C0958 [Corymbia citriodora subsp. variegata]